MRSFVMFLCAMTLSGCLKRTESTALKSEAEKPFTSLELRFNLFGEVLGVTQESAVSLDVPFDPLGARAPKSICYAGDVQQVCSLLSRMSHLSKKAYAAGEHGVSLLVACNLDDQAQKVQATVEESDDYDSESHKITSIIVRCE